MQANFIGRIIPGAAARHDTPMSSPYDKATVRKQLIERRLAMADREAKAEALQQALRFWLVGRPDTVIAGYWAIKGEFDPLPALYRWQEAESDAGRHRRICLPVMDKATKTLTFHAWYPGCPMQEDAFGLPKPKDTDKLQPTVILIPCVGYGPSGLRLGYGGGFFDRTLAQLSPKPHTVGVAYSNAFMPLLKAEPHDVPLDTILTEEGQVWPMDLDA
jgi:5,10-methenyltetrahydrofolate synthetase